MILRVLLLTIALTCSAFANVGSTLVFFECNTPDEAIQVAHSFDEIIPNLSPLPGSCIWIEGERQADILELVQPVELSDGRIVWIGLVSRAQATPKYSAGFLELALM